jgi:hypothetical protein
MYLVFNLGLIVFGAGIGSLIHWILPSVDLGTGILIGLVATGFSIHYFTRVMSLVEVFDDTDEEDDDDIPPRFRVLPVPPTRPGRRRKRK